MRDPANKNAHARKKTANFVELATYLTVNIGEAELLVSKLIQVKKCMDSPGAAGRLVESNHVITTQLKTLQQHLHDR